MSLARFRDIHRGESAFILGNGPSLLGQADLLKRLDGRVTFVCNQAYLWADMPFRPTYYAINSNKRHRDLLPAHQYQDWRDVPKFLFKKAYPSYALPTGWLHVPADFGRPMREHGFRGLSPELGMLSVARAMPLTIAQLAAWMGCDAIHFVGNDQTRTGHVYALTGPLAERRKDGGLGDPLTDREWVENEAATAADFARAVADIQSVGRVVFDCTPGGRMVREGIVPYRTLEDALDD